MMMPPIVIENTTITGAVMFGHTWRLRMCQGALPMARAASK